MPPNVHIVIPNYNNYPLINELLFSLYKFERENIASIHVVDDCSTDPEVFSGLNWWKSGKMLPLTIYNNEENLGFLKTANFGLHEVCEHQNRPSDDIAILLSTDVKIYGKFIQKLLFNFESEEPTIVGGVLYAHDTGWNTFNGKIFPYLEGWMLATQLGNWWDLDYFDDRYAPCDYEDIDLSTTALANGYTLTPLNSPNLQHLGGRSISYGDARLANTNKNKKLFEEKWIK